jgi:hypothetical protein
MPTAVEQIRRMRGGAQAQLMRCRQGQDDAYYIVKFQHNPQHQRVLWNELFGTRLAAQIGLPTPPAAVVEVGPELIGASSELAFQIGQTVTKFRAGKHFGSRYPGDPSETTVFDFLPDEQLAEVDNLADFAGALVFDKFTCNTNGRQAIFFRELGRSRYTAQFIDFGFCFNAGEWNFPDAPLRGIYARQRVYQHVTGMDSFEPWIERIEKRASIANMGGIAAEIPPEWYDDDTAAVERLLEQLERRRKKLRELILDARNSYRQPFANWTR